MTFPAILGGFLSKDSFHEHFRFIKHLSDAYYVLVTALIAKDTKIIGNDALPPPHPHSTAGGRCRQLTTKNVANTVMEKMNKSWRTIETEKFILPREGLKEKVIFELSPDEWSGPC